MFYCTLKQKFPPKFYTSFKIAFLLRRSLWEKFCGDFKDGAFRGVGIWHMHLLQRCLVHTGCCHAIWHIHHVATLSGTYTILQHSLAHTPCCKVLGTYTMLQRYLAHTPCCNAVWHIHHVATLFGTDTMLQRSLAHTPFCNAFPAICEDSLHECTHNKPSVTSSAFAVWVSLVPFSKVKWRIYERNELIIYRLVRYFLHSGRFAFLKATVIDCNLC